MRVMSLDVVRAMAIVFVVVGHALIYADCGGVLMSCIYSFHMPLLFVLSGFVAAASWERSGQPCWRLAASPKGVAGGAISRIEASGASSLMAESRASIRSTQVSAG